MKSFCINQVLTPPVNFLRKHKSAIQISVTSVAISALAALVIASTTSVAFAAAFPLAIGAVALVASTITLLYKLRKRIQLRAEKRVSLEKEKIVNEFKAAKLSKYKSDLNTCLKIESLVHCFKLYIEFQLVADCINRLNFSNKDQSTHKESLKILTNKLFEQINSYCNEFFDLNFVEPKYLHDLVSDLTNIQSESRYDSVAKLTHYFSFYESFINENIVFNDIKLEIFINKEDQNLFDNLKYRLKIGNFARSIRVPLSEEQASSLVKCSLKLILSILRTALINNPSTLSNLIENKYLDEEIIHELKRAAIIHNYFKGPTNFFAIFKAIREDIKKAALQAPNQNLLELVNNLFPVEIDEPLAIEQKTRPKLKGKSQYNFKTKSEKKIFSFWSNTKSAIKLLNEINNCKINEKLKNEEPKLDDLSNKLYVQYKSISNLTSELFKINLDRRSINIIIKPFLNHTNNNEPKSKTVNDLLYYLSFYQEFVDANSSKEIKVNIPASLQGTSAAAFVEYCKILLKICINTTDKSSEIFNVNSNKYTKFTAATNKLIIAILKKAYAPHTVTMNHYHCSESFSNLVNQELQKAKYIFDFFETKVSLQSIHDKIFRSILEAGKKEPSKNFLTILNELYP